MSTGSTSALQNSGMVPQFFPCLGPALMISMAYIDLGKWVAAVEGGACFGFNLVLLAFFLNFCAIFCQYLATSIGVATGKNLAQIYSKEYSRSVCIMLGLEAEVSAIQLDISTILGIAHGLNVISGLDILTCILSSAVGSLILPFFITHLVNSKAEVLYIVISGFALFFHVIGVLISQPEIPLATNGIFPRLSGETAYSLMALLGANIMVHNFYTHSSIVQQKRPSNVAVGALSHDHFFAILFVFSGIFLVNYVLMNSAASVFDNAGLVALTFQDVFLMLDQGILEPAFSKPRSPFPCPCLSIPAAHRKTHISPSQNGLQLSAGRTSRGTCTSAITVLDIIKDVESAISNRKGRTGTAAGDIAFPKGKENLASVLKRYKRRLSNKSPGNCDVGSLSRRKVPVAPTSAS